MKTLVAFIAVLVASSQLPAQDWNVAGLSDYTTDSKATKSVMGGDFPRGLYVAPEEHSPIWIWATPKLAELDTKITWRITPESLENFGPGAIACYDAPTTQLKWNARIIFRDLEEPSAKMVEKTVGKEFSTGLNRFYIIYTDPDQDTRTEVIECRSRDQFEGNWGKALTRSKTHRFILTQNMAWLTRVPSNAADSRESLVAEYLGETAHLVASLTENPQSSVLAATTYKKKTDELFELLNGKVIIDDKLKSYELYWHSKRDQLTADGADNVNIDIKQFQVNLLAATKNTKCTVKVFATNGHHAEIRVAKRDRQFKSLGPSVVTTELERASYYFEAWRNGKKTGETTSPVDCTGKSQEITIAEK